MMDTRSYTRREIRALWVMAWLLRAINAVTIVAVWRYERGTNRLIVLLFIGALIFVEVWFVRGLKRLKPKSTTDRL